MGATSLDLSQIKTDVLSAASTFRTLIGLGNVNNTADLDKPISTATQSALDAKVNLAGDTMTGTLTAPEYRSPRAGSLSHVNPQNNIVLYGGFSGYGIGFDGNGELGTVVNSTLRSRLGQHLGLGSAAQSANLVEVQDVSQNVLASIDKDGDVVANSGSFHTVQLTSSLPRQSGVLFLDNNKLLTTSTNFIHDNSNPASPKLIFKASGNATPDISLNVLTSASGSSSGVQTLSFEGSAGQLFSVSDVLNSGTIFGVNDISGLPLLEVDATGLISLARFGTGINAHRAVNALEGLVLTEISTPPTPAANSCRIYAKDNGSGKTQLVVLMPDGVETVLVTQT